MIVVLLLMVIPVAAVEGRLSSSRLLGRLRRRRREGTQCPRCNSFFSYVHQINSSFGTCVDRCTLSESQALRTGWKCGACPTATTARPSSAPSHLAPSSMVPSDVPSLVPSTIIPSAVPCGSNGANIPNAPPGSACSGSDHGGDEVGNGGLSPIVGDTKDGPKEPAVEVPKEEAQANRDEFVTTLVDLYDRHAIDWTSLSQNGTPQFKALLFVTASSNYSTMSQSQRVQRFVLAVFYYSTFMQAHAFWTDPTDWTSSWRWMSSEDECLWEGIACQSNETTSKNDVTAIILPSHALSGHLPLELALLDQLKDIDLCRNFLHMNPTDHEDLRVFGMLSQLERLEVGGNFILTTEEQALPRSLGNLVHLRRLSLSYNLLQGRLDGSFFQNLQQLTHLEIESNYLSGSLPDELGQLKNLYFIYLRKNLLQIDLDQLLLSNADGSAASYRNVFSLWLDDNQFVGSIPTAIGDLTGLASFSITHTALGGSIPSELGQCRELRRLRLYRNQLHGKLPTKLAQLQHLQVLEIHDNQVTGIVPPEVCDTIAMADYEFKALTADYPWWNAINVVPSVIKHEQSQQNATYVMHACMLGAF